MSEGSGAQLRYPYKAFLDSLPTDWETKPISQLGAVVGGGTPSRDVRSFWRGTIPWVTPGEVSGEASKYLHDTADHISAAGLAGSGANLLPSGSLMVTTRATLGARAINAVPMATNQGFKSVVFKQMQDADYYFHLFEKVKPELVRRGSGTTFLEVSGAEFGAIFVPSPPRCEKQHIAQILDTLDIAIQQTEAFIAKLNAAQLGLLHDLLTRGIDANGELRTPQIDAPHLYQASPVGWIPIGWTYLTLKEAAESIIDGPFGSNLKTEHYVPDSGVRVVRLQNIQLGGYDDTDRAFISDKHAASLARNRVTAGDALIASLGDDSYPIGRSCLYPADLPDAVNKADCFRFRGKSTCRNAYVALFMNSLAARRQIRGYEQGVTMKRINLGNLKRVCVSLPRAAEQELIIDRAATAAAQIDANVRQLRKLRHQRLGLSDDLLTGRVRVSSLLTKTEQAALEAAS